MIHDPIRPSIEQLFAQWKTEQAFAATRQALERVQDDCTKREKLWTQFEESQDAMRAIQTQVLAQIDATFGPGMGEAVKEMIGG
jgi:hypothetical protein